MMRTLDDRPLPKMPVKDAHWLELKRLLADTSPVNALYAVQQLNAMSKVPGRDWAHTDGFPREAVLKTLLPLVSHANDDVAIAAIGCFRGGAPGTEPNALRTDALVSIASYGSSVPRRVAALAALSGNTAVAVRKALPKWLADSSPLVRAQSVLLLPVFPGAFAESALRKLAEDPSPEVRASVADAISNGCIKALLPLLETLLEDPVGRAKPVPPLTIQQLQSGGRVWGGNNGDVHTAAGYALLKFDVDQVRDILAAHLDDPGFRPGFLCKLAEHDAGPWLTNLVDVLEARRHQVEQEVATSGVEPQAAYLQARMHLSGTYFRCWNIIYDHLKALPPAAFTSGKLEHCLDELARAGTTGSREPVMIYELLRMKGLARRAEQYRATAEARFPAYNLKQFFDAADARHSVSNP